MTPYFLAAFFIAASSVAAIAEVTCLGDDTATHYDNNSTTSGSSWSGEGDSLVMGGHSNLVVPLVLGILDQETGVVGYLEPLHPTNQLCPEGWRERRGERQQDIWKGCLLVLLQAL